MPGFEKGEAFKYGWDTTLANFWNLFFTSVVFFAVVYAPYVFAETSTNSTIKLAINLFMIPVQIWLGMNYIRIFLGYLDGKKGNAGNLFDSIDLRTVANYVVGSILYGLIVAAGLILLIIPGIIWAIKFNFVYFLIIDKGMGPIEALKKSSQMTNGIKVNMLLMWLITLGIIILGLLALVLGLFFAIPTTYLAYAYIYRKLVSQADPKKIKAPKKRSKK